MIDKKLIEESLKTINILFDEPLSNYTFTKVGGPADVLVFPKNKNELKQVLDFIREQDAPWLVLGNASNLIVRDGGIRGFVLMLTDMLGCTLEGNELSAQAGEQIIDVSKIAADHSLSGLEFACGIPGSIGGAVYMNAGAYGGEVVDVLKSAEILLEDGRIETWSNEDLNFSYRYSKLQENQAIVLSATFYLMKKNQEEILAQMEDLSEKRQSKQPLEYPSCGSVFKRPEGHFTGALIQEAHLQGLVMGGVQISEKHAGFIVNINQGTASDYEALIEHIIKVVEKHSGVTLEPEVRIIGEKK